MPYIKKGKTVYKKIDGLKKVGSSKTMEMAKNYYKTLQAVEHGWRPTRKKK
jgi:hypothetical protein